MALRERQQPPADEPVAGPGVRRLVVVPDFFAEAVAMRQTFDERFGRVRSRGEESFVWDYWHVPDQYTYFRTFGDRYFPEELTQAFLKRLREWGRDVLGCPSVTPPWLSYYLDGCVQELHADVPHGPWAYVFSITRWDERGFTGGETELMQPRTLEFWPGFDPSEELEAHQLMERVPASFNQLTVFDARIPHAVRAVRGTRDPMDSRVVLHGWFEYPDLTLSDDLRDEKTQISLRLATRYLAKRLAPFAGVTGLLTVRVEFAADGAVRATRVLSNTLVSRDAQPTLPAEIVRSVHDSLRELSVPGASEGSWAIVPVRMPSHA
jgi:hypothetical protein